MPLGSGSRTQPKAVLAEARDRERLRLADRIGDRKQLVVDALGRRGQLHDEPRKTPETGGVRSNPLKLIN